MSTPKYSLFSNSRFYILAASFLASMMAIGFLRLNIPDDQLYLIRLEQVYGLLAVLFWYAAMMISPIGHVIGKERTKKLAFARRGIGVSAFYFALLHGAVALWGQLGGVSHLGYLPDLFKWSLAAGTFAFFVLFILALTSFDKVVSIMTFARWKLLHRLTYIGGILALLHIWTVGTHLAYGHIQAMVFAALLVLYSLELHRFVKHINEKKLRLDKAEFFTLYASAVVIAAVLTLAVPALIQNYHSRHTNHNDSAHSEEHL